MSKAFGIVNFSGNHIWVNGLQEYRPIGAFSFLGRYRIIDFPISNMSNSDIDHIQVYIRRKPRSLTEHIGTGRHYNINSKRGKIRILYSQDGLDSDNIYNTDIASFRENLDVIEKEKYPYVVIAPSYMIYSADFDTLLENHISSEADITMLYHTVDNADDEEFLNCSYLDLNKQKGVQAILPNRGTAKNRQIFMDTYIMKKSLLIELINKAEKISSIYTLNDVINACLGDYDVRGVSHRGYFAAITNFKGYYKANMSLVDFKTSASLFDEEWPIYTRTNDSSPTHYFEDAEVKGSVISNGCHIEGVVENSVVGRGCVIETGAVVKNSVLLPGTFVGKNVHIENYVVDKGAKIIHSDSGELVAAPEHPGYVKRRDTL